MVYMAIYYMYLHSCKLECKNLTNRLTNKDVMVLDFDKCIDFDVIHNVWTMYHPALLEYICMQRNIYKWYIGNIRYTVNRCNASHSMNIYNIKLDMPMKFTFITKQIF